MSRRNDLDKDTRRFFEGVLLALAATVFVIALCLMAWAASADPLPASVYVTERHYELGARVYECWLDSANYGPIGTGYGLIVECHSDIDGIFKNGFETQAPIVVNMAQRP